MLCAAAEGRFCYARHYEGGGVVQEGFLVVYFSFCASLLIWGDLIYAVAMGSITELVWGQRWREFILAIEGSFRIVW